MLTFVEDFFRFFFVDHLNGHSECKRKWKIVLCSDCRRCHCTPCDARILSAEALVEFIFVVWFSELPIIWLAILVCLVGLMACIERGHKLLIEVNSSFLNSSVTWLRCLQIWIYNTFVHSWSHDDSPVHLYLREGPSCWDVIKFYLVFFDLHFVISSACGYALAMRLGILLISFCKRFRG